MDGSRRPAEQECRNISVGKKLPWEVQDADPTNEDTAKRLTVAVRDLLARVRHAIKVDRVEYYHMTPTEANERGRQRNATPEEVRDGIHAELKRRGLTYDTASPGTKRLLDELGQS